MRFAALILVVVFKVFRLIVAVVGVVLASSIVPAVGGDTNPVPDIVWTSYVRTVQPLHGIALDQNTFYVYYDWFQGRGNKGSIPGLPRLAGRSGSKPNSVEYSRPSSAGIPERIIDAGAGVDPSTFIELTAYSRLNVVTYSGTSYTVPASYDLAKYGPLKAVSRQIGNIVAFVDGKMQLRQLNLSNQSVSEPILTVPTTKDVLGMDMVLFTFSGQPQLRYFFTTSEKSTNTPPQPVHSKTITASSKYDIEEMDVPEYANGVSDIAYDEAKNLVYATYDLGMSGGNIEVGDASNWFKKISARAPILQLLNPRIQNGQFLYDLVTQTDAEYTQIWFPSIGSTWGSAGILDGTGGLVTVTNDMKGPSGFFYVKRQ